MVTSLEQLADAVIETDFLIVGGGLVGSMAAIKARKADSKIDITLIDKATMEYSGDGVGLDNFTHLPLHKEDLKKKDVSVDDVKKAVFGSGRFKGLRQADLEAKQIKYAYISQPILEEIGVKVWEDDGSLKVLQGYRKGTVWGPVEYDENGKPEEPLFGSISRASALKMKLGTAVRKSGTKVFDRTMVTSIITKDGIAIGATALNTRNGKFFVFKAKAVLLATGGANRLYPYQWAPFPNNLFYTLMSPVNHGGGYLCALNAGARLFSMELNTVYIVSKGINHSSGGGACNWYFKMYNSKGEYLEDKYPDRVVTKAGGMIPGVNFLYSPDMNNPEYERDVILSAKDKATSDELVGTYFTAATEPPKALKFHMLAGGLTNELPVECVPVPVGINMAGGGVFRENEYSESSVKNLFVGGYAAGRGSSAGLTWGCLIADHVTELIKNLKVGKIDADQLQQVEETRRRVFSPFGRGLDYKINPLELEDYVRNVNLNYVGIHRIKPKMERALELLGRAKEGAAPLLVAQNAHELMRVLEVKDIIELSELHTQSAIMRTESRLVPVHYRDDYPELDPEWDGIVVTVKKKGEELTYEKTSLN
jgi:adenylylsulfate reductase subunit A